ncbi:DUF6239 family natural product biosynthesis protein [Actinoplanes sp. NPDC023801]|uniref:DUF6239 family natural product biosynthesis protein n=1 Tax=Actinoplanes sp. NPDC023801 TaxID=3154595 RepID=UPI0033D4A8EF
MGHQHGHLDLGATTGALGLQILVVAAGLLVAVAVLSRPFRRATGSRTEVAATVAAATAVPAYLLLADALAVAQQLVPLMLVAVALPVVVTAGRDRAAPAFRQALRRAAPAVLAVCGTAAVFMFARAWMPGGPTAALHTGLILALLAASWSMLCRPGAGPRAVWLHGVTGVVAAAMLAATVQADALATAA